MKTTIILKPVEPSKTPLTKKDMKAILTSRQEQERILSEVLKDWNPKIDHSKCCGPAARRAWEKRYGVKLP